MEPIVRWLAFWLARLLHLLATWYLWPFKEKNLTISMPMRGQKIIVTARGVRLGLTWYYFHHEKSEGVFFQELYLALVINQGGDAQAYPANLQSGRSPLNLSFDNQTLNLWVNYSPGFLLGPRLAARYRGFYTDFDMLVKLVDLDED